MKSKNDELRKACGFKHVEAFCRMLYRDEEGNEEWLWNSRDGVTPFSIATRDGNGLMKHVEWGCDQFMPNYRPKIGERIFVDVTAELAGPHLRARIARQWDSMSTKFASKEHAFEALLPSCIWPGHPFVLEITEHNIEQFVPRIRPLIVTASRIRPLTVTALWTQGSGQWLFRDGVAAARVCGENEQQVAQITDEILLACNNHADLMALAQRVANWDFNLDGDCVAEAQSLACRVLNSMHGESEEEPAVCDWIRVKNHEGGYLGICKHCGSARHFTKEQVVGLTIREFTALLQVFMDEHSNCVKPTEGEVP